MRREAHAAECVPGRRRPEPGPGGRMGRGRPGCGQKFAGELSAWNKHRKEVRKLHHQASPCMYIRLFSFLNQNETCPVVECALKLLVPAMAQLTLL